MSKWFKSYSDLYFLDQDLKRGNEVLSNAVAKQKLQKRVKALEKAERSRALTQSELVELVELRRELL